MKVFGLTGGIGAGKSTIAKIFMALDIPVYSSDEAAKWLMQNDPQLVEGIKYLLGNEAFDKNGKLQTTWIASRVFHDETALQALNQLVHPAVAHHSRIWADQQVGAPYLIREAALLIESGAYLQLDGMIGVSAPEDLRIWRVMNRNNFTKAQVLERIRNQMPEEERLRYCQFVIYNDALKQVLPQVLSLHEELKA
jgi:dephospho-CoA kinase